MGITVQQLEHNLNLPLLLEVWGLDISTLHQASQIEWRSHCFIHGGDGDSALSIRFVHDRIYLSCYSHGCFHGSLVQYGLKMGKTYSQIIEDYILCQGIPNKKKYNHKDIQIYNSSILPSDIMNKYIPSIHLDYIKLGYNRDVLRNIFDVRYDNNPNSPLYGRVVYPIRDKMGNIRSIQGRKTEASPKSSPKYLFLPGYNVKNFLFGAYEMRNIIPLHSYIVVVESPKSVMRGYQLGFPVLSLLGIQYKKQQVESLASYGKRLILVADNDESMVGIRGMEKLSYDLNIYVPTRVSIVPDIGKDISDYLTADEWYNILI